MKRSGLSLRHKRGNGCAGSDVCHCRRHRVELEDLAHQLASGQFAHGGWLASDAFSLADVQWGAVLYRLQWVGLQPLLLEKDSIISLTPKSFFKASFQTGVIEWSRVGRKVVLPTIRYKLLEAFGLARHLSGVGKTEWKATIWGE